MNCGANDWSKGIAVVFNDTHSCEDIIAAIHHYDHSPRAEGTLEVVPLLTPDEVEARERAAWNAAYQTGFEFSERMAKYATTDDCVPTYAAWQESQK